MDAVPGAESMASLIIRAKKIADLVITIPEDNALIVSHGSFGRALRQILHPDIAFGDEQFDNGEVVQLL
jgi:broad specificity phosphatase PhoE